MIQRDGRLVSLWQQHADEYQSNTIAARGQQFDVIIAGGGITGLATALALQEKGMRVIVLEAQTLGFGTTSGTTAHINTLLDTPYSMIKQHFNKEVSQAVAAHTAAAVNLVRKNISDYNINCGFAEADAFLFAQTNDEAKELDTIFEATSEAGVGVTYVEDLDKFPFEFQKAFRATGQAKFNPINYIHAIAEIIEKNGGSIITSARVVSVTEEENTVTVETSAGTFSGSHMIYATHVPPGINLLHLRCAPWRSYAMAVELSDGEQYPAHLAYDMKDPYNYYRAQEVDGKQYLIVGGKDHKTGTEENPQYLFEELEATIRKDYKVDKVVNRWSSQYYESNDGLPYIGLLPGSKGHVYVATGFGGNGMTYSHVAARLLSENLAGTTEIPSYFSPSRLKPVAGFTSFISHNADAVANFAAKLVAPDKLQELSDLARGEGRLVKFDDKKMGIFKDEQGNLHAINPTCTHMKCDIKWNNAECSWDCPCHGGRFDPDGKVLTAPADRDLSVYDLEQISEQADAATSK